MNTFLKSLPLFFLLTACSSSENDKLLYGNWSAAEWQINGVADPSLKDTHFSFNEKGEYTFQSGKLNQAGTYRLSDNKLYTTPKDQQEIMVKILKLNADSLVFDMNRSGVAETLILVKK